MFVCDSRGTAKTIVKPNGCGNDTILGLNDYRPPTAQKL